MIKKKWKLLLILTLLVIIELCVFIYSLFYFSKGNLSIRKVISNPNVQLEGEQRYLKKDLVKKEKIDYSKEDGLGAVTITYSLLIENIDNKVNTLTISLNNNNKINYKLNIYDQNNHKKVIGSEKNIEISENKYFMEINQSVKKITLIANYDLYNIKNHDSIEKKAKELFHIEEININKKKDLLDARKIVLRKSILVLFFTILITILCIVIIKKKIVLLKNVKIEKFFFTFSILVGSLLSLLFPLYQIPDELTHINLIYEELGYNIDFNEKTHNYAGSSELIRNSGNKVNTKEYFNFNQKIGINPRLKIPSILIIRHLPQAIGLFLGMLLHLPLIVTITFSELLALFLYSFVCYKALMYIPMKKNIMMLIMLLPICLQQAGSFSYDVVLNCTCFLLISYILYIKFQKEYFTLKDILKIGGMLLVIGLCKIPYVLLGLLVFLIPIRKYNLSFKCLTINDDFIRKNKYKIIAITCILMLPFLYIIYKILGGFSYGRLLLASIRSIKSSLSLVCHTFTNGFLEYVSTIWKKMGWFDLILSNIFMVYSIVMFICICFYNGSYNEKREEIVFNKVEILFIYIVLFAGIYLICLSMFFWTLSASVVDCNKLSINEIRSYLHSLKYIGGIQGRYFVPFLPLLVIPIHSERISKLLMKLNIRTFEFIYYIVLASYLIIAVLMRYWIT